MEETTSLRDEIKELKEIVVEEAKSKKKKPRKFRLPAVARVSKARLKKGFVTIAKIEDNKTVDFIKEEIIDGTIKIGDTFHAVEDFDIFTYKGKPIVFQAKSKLNPYNPLEGSNETYGQKYVMARMIGDRIMAKKSAGWAMGIGVVVVIAIIIYALIGG